MDIFFILAKVWMEVTQHCLWTLNIVKIKPKNLRTMLIYKTTYFLAEFLMVRVEDFTFDILYLTT